MSRAKVYGYIVCIISVVLGYLYFKHAFYNFTGFNNLSITDLSNYSYYAITIPIALVTISVLCLGIWIGWTIISIKVVPPMPEIGEKKDFAKFKAFLLCIFTLFLIVLFLYGIYIQSFWALAVPASIITIVILGMIFWVGIAIITTRSTLPKKTED
ncbi:MAG: hypothetical protein SVR08_08950 [Spirochaetota bacterium]|nr:hypothetical protein [Spirochaetota bacterium]